MHHAVFARVVADQPVVFAVQPLARAIGRALNCRSPGATLYLPDVEMVERQSLTVLWQQGFDFGQVEDAFGQLVKLALAHALDGWHNALYRRSTRDKPVASLLVLAVLQILNLLLNALVAVFGLV